MNTDENLKRYLEEIGEIKSLLNPKEDGGYVVWWAYLLWGVFCLTCSSLHGILVLGGRMDNAQAFLWVWLPAIIISGIIEFWGWFSKMGKTGRPLLTGKLLRFFVMLVAALALLLVILPSIERDPLAPVSAFVFVAIGFGFVLFAQQTLDSFYFMGGTMVVIGILLYFLGVSETIVSMSAGLLSGVFLVTGSAIARRLEKPREKRNV